MILGHVPAAMWRSCILTARAVHEQLVQVACKMFVVWVVVTLLQSCLLSWKNEWRKSTCLSKKMGELQDIFLKIWYLRWSTGIASFSQPLHFLRKFFGSKGARPASQRAEGIP